MSAELDLYLDMGRGAARDTWRGLRQSPTVLVAPVALAVGSRISAHWLGGLGLAGTLAQLLLTCAVFSSWLYFIRELVNGSRTSLAELPQSLVPFLGDAFAPMILGLGLMVASVAMTFLVPCVGCLFGPLVTLINPVFEVLYSDKGRDLGDLFRASVDFVRRNFWPWLAFNLLLAATIAPVYVGIYVASGVAATLLELDPALVSDAASIGVAGPLIFAALVFRGHLFRALDPGTHRTRMFRARAAREPHR